MKHFLTLLDFTPDEITGLIDLAADLKTRKKAGIPHDICQGKSIALIFEKTSTRTRCSFEVAAYDLGMHVTYLDPSGSQIGKKESIADTARVLGRLYDGIEYRGFGQEIVEELAKHAGVPVWNGLTNEYHPTQVLADMLTIREHLGELKGKTLAQLTLDEFCAVHPAFDEGVYEAIDLMTCVSQRSSHGGPAVKETTRQIADVEAFIAKRS